MSVIDDIMQEINSASRRMCTNEIPSKYYRAIGTRKVEEIIRRNLNGKGTDVPAKDGWIPVEERLPEVCRKIEEDSECPEYNVTIQGAEKATTLKYSPADETWFDDFGYVYPVVAWQPLPEVYRLERSET